MNRVCQPNLYLAGMIGVGKTTIGQIVASKLGRPFFDFDWELRKETGLDLHAMVGERGWLDFRVCEYAIIKRLSREEGAVVSLGGGTVRYQWNLDAMAGTGPIVLLTADLDTLADRVRVADRPRVNPGTTLEEDLQIIWGKNKDLYLKAATYVYKTDRGLSADQEAGEIIKLIAEWTPAGESAPRQLADA